jgi:hypothetical protein
MSEVEFDRLLDVVRAAVVPTAVDEATLAPIAHPPLCRAPSFRSASNAANDNGAAWPLIPFPEDWFAAC